mmetsp:Transcript_29511/g.39419  ORF Transcript_29511/g.39419 Transcript_29511/m.39419 type:complete len:83 (+) Transcript_29511:574-822(+)
MSLLMQRIIRVSVGGQLLWPWMVDSMWLSGGEKTRLEVVRSEVWDPITPPKNHTIRFWLLFVMNRTICAQFFLMLKLSLDKH